MSDDLPTFQEGQTIAIGGEHYTVAGVDPRPDGVRAYHLHGNLDETVRLEPYSSRGRFTLIRVAELDPDDIVGVGVADDD